MKFFLHKILVLIIGVCLLSAYFEFNDAEKKQNYEKESHSFVISKTTDHFKLTSLITVIPERIFLLVLNENPQEQDFLFPSNIEYSPPERLHLLHSVFLI